MQAECAKGAIAEFEEATGGEDLASVKTWGEEKKRLETEVMEWKARATNAGSHVSVEVLKLIQAGQTDQMKTLLAVVQALTNQRVEPEVGVPDPKVGVPAQAPTVAARIGVLLQITGTETPEGGFVGWNPALEAAERSLYGTVKSRLLMDHVVDLERQLGVGGTTRF